MSDDQVTAILVAIAEVKGQLAAQTTEGTRTTARLDSHASRLDKLERLVWFAVGAALASGVPQLVGLIP